MVGGRAGAPPANRPPPCAWKPCRPVLGGFQIIGFSDGEYAGAEQVLRNDGIFDRFSSTHDIFVGGYEGTRGSFDWLCGPKLAPRYYSERLAWRQIIQLLAISTREKCVSSIFNSVRVSVSAEVHRKTRMHGAGIARTYWAILAQCCPPRIQSARGVSRQVLFLPIPITGLLHPSNQLSHREESLKAVTAKAGW